MVEMAVSDVFGPSKALPGVGLAKSLRTSWEQQLLVDYTIQVEDEEFKVHKIVMASVSDYFKAMLAAGMIDSQADRARLEGFSSLAVQNIIEYVYTNEISGPAASAEEFLACAVYLQIPCAIEAGTKLLWGQLNVQNVFDVCATFKMYSLTEAIEHTHEYLKAHLDEICDIQKSEVYGWPFQRFQIFCEIWDSSEIDLFLAIRKWVKRSYKNRKKHLKSLMNLVQFCLMNPAEMKIVRSIDIYSDKSWHELVDAAQDYHNLPTHQKMLQTFRVRTDARPVCFHTDGTQVLYRLDVSGWWDTDSCPKIPKFKNGIATCVEFNNFLLVCESYSKNQKWHVFDARTFQWSKMAKMVTPKADFALVHDGKESVYALGGRVNVGTDTESVTDMIEKYDIRTDTWSVLDSTLPIPLQLPCACLGFGSIYVAGGWETLDKSVPYSKRMDSFDTSQSPIVWESKPPMWHSSPCHVMHSMEYLGEKVIVLLNEDFMLQFYKPYLNRWHYWQNITDHYKAFRFHPHSRVLAAQKENALFLLNFDGDCECPCEFSEECMGACMRWRLCREDNLGYTLNETSLLTFPETFEVSEWEEDTEKKWYISAMLALPPTSQMMDLPCPVRGRSRHNNRRR